MKLILGNNIINSEDITKETQQKLIELGYHELSEDPPTIIFEEIERSDSDE